MFEVVWLILAESLSIDANTNKISIINVMNQAWADKFPARVTNLNAIVRLRKQDKTFFNGKIDVKVVVSQAQKKIAEVTHDPMNVVMEGAGSIIPLNLSDIPLPGPGRYDISLYINDELLAEDDINLKSTSELTEK